MPIVVWGTLEKSQIDNEKIEEAVARLIQAHEDDSNAHVEIGESLYSHKAAAIIDHLVASIIADKIKDLEVTTGKLANQAVTEGKIGNLAVAEGKIGNEAVTDAKIHDLNLNKVTAGILTGRTIRTGSGNERVELVATGGLAHHLTWYYGGVLATNIYEAADGLSIFETRAGKGILISIQDGADILLTGNRVELDYTKMKNAAADPGGIAGLVFYHTVTDHFRGYGGEPNAWRDLCYYDERNEASPIPTFVSGLEQLKRIKAPTTLVKEGLCFDTGAFPIEFQIIKSGKRDSKHIDLRKVIGMNVQALKELDERVKDLELK